MLRRLLILLFVVANLSTQVSVAYACAMMGTTTQVMKHCCCKTDQAEPDCDEGSMDQGCCTTVIDVADGPGDQVGNTGSATKLADIDPQTLAALLPVLLSLVPPSQTAAIAWNRAQDPRPPGTDLYLRTQRLRL